VFAAWVTKVALKCNFNDFKIVFGFVELCGKNGTWYDEHIWIEHNGKKIDPTVAQFSPYFVKYARFSRKKYTAEVFSKKKNFFLKPDWVKKHLKVN
jgi:hypothetical protein